MNASVAFMKVKDEVRSIRLRENDLICTVPSEQFEIEERDLSHLIACSNVDAFEDDEKVTKLVAVRENKKDGQCTAVNLEDGSSFALLTEEEVKANFRVHSVVLT